jgi:uncharacterized protein
MEDKEDNMRRDRTPTYFLCVKQMAQQSSQIDLIISYTLTSQNPQKTIQVHSGFQYFPWAMVPSKSIISCLYQTHLLVGKRLSAKLFFATPSLSTYPCNRREMVRVDAINNHRQTYLMIITRRSFTAGFLVFASQGCAAEPASAPQSNAQSTSRATKLIAAARKQIGVTLTYDPAYTGLPFPNGDVPRSKGVCTDVVIRAYRDAFGVDLQALVNADMKANFAAYPKIWGLRRADSHIDHRRVPNLQTFLLRKGAALPVTNNAGDWLPGDIVTSLVGGKLPHIGIVSDRVSGATPLVIHNIGAGTREEDQLFAHKLTGHFRWQVA